MLQTALTEDLIEAGCDEAGRGCLAGPVFAAAVILPKTFSNSLLNDSKKLSEKQRLYLRDVIEYEAIEWAAAKLDQTAIDEINILNASIKSMHLAVDQLKIRPQLLLIDGNLFKPYPGIQHQCFVKGDGKFASIAAASILAKTYRDEFMERIHLEYPHYHWDQNKGYPTRLHKDAINVHGVCSYHRKSFKLGDQLKIDF